MPPNKAEEKPRSPRADRFGKGQKRVTKAQLGARQRHVEELHFERLQNRITIESTLAAQWGCSDRTIRRYLTQVYLHRAKQRAAQPGADDIDRDRFRESVVDLYSRCLDAKDFANANRAQERIGRLEGLLRAPHLNVDVKHTGTVGHVHITAEQLAEALEEATPEAIEGLKLLAGKLLAK